MSENGNIEEEWLAKTGRAPKPEGEYIPAEPETVNVKGLSEWLDTVPGHGQASYREYFADKGYDIETVIGFYHSAMERRAARPKPNISQPIPWIGR